MMPSLKSETESLKEQLKLLQEIIPAVITEIEKSPDRSLIPEGAELLTVPQVARLTGWGESVVRQRDRKGLLPAPLRFGGTIQWSRKELLAWIGAGGPPRQKWELIKQRKEA
ncbi:MAG: helix-turn-helix transcriptional regulator [Planctomycetota bacterium]|jgi:predicted DNA-binding transcriptional regulator AlpA